MAEDDRPHRRAATAAARTACRRFPDAAASAPTLPASAAPASAAPSRARRLCRCRAGSRRGAARAGRRAPQSERAAEAAPRCATAVRSVRWCTGSRASIVSASATNAASAESSASISCLTRDSDRTRARSSCGWTGFDRILVRAGFDAVDAIGQPGLAGDQHHRRQARGRIRFQPPADLEAVDERHRHVEENDVGPVAMNGGQRGCAVGSEHDVMAVGAEEPMKERADALPVIGDQHAAPPRSPGSTHSPARPQQAAPRPCHATVPVSAAGKRACTEIRPWPRSWHRTAKQ